MVFRQCSNAVFRAAPIAGYAVLARAVRVRDKCAAALALAFLGYAADMEVQALEGMALAYAYFVVVSLALPALARGVRAGALTNGGAFAVLALAFLAVPAVAWPDAAKAMTLVVGWDLVLSGYSLCIEAAKAESAPPIGECLFFLLVNPALVYTLRGRRLGPPRLDPRGAGRALAGLGVLLVVCALLVPRYEAAGAGPAGGVARGALRFLVEYGRQSAVASFQIGLMRQVGYEIPERFRWPILATSPLEFWRRWNTYVGQWMLRYVFWPLCVRLRRSSVPTGWVSALGILLTFTAVGALHDVYTYAGDFTIETRMTQLFAANGVLVVATVGIRAWAEARAAHGDDTRTRLGGWVMAGSRVLLWAVITGSFAAWWR